MFVYVGVLLPPCTMRPVYPHEYYIHQNIPNCIRIVQNLLARTLSLWLSCHTIRIHSQTNNHSQIQLQHFIYTKSASIHTFVMISWLGRIFFPWSTLHLFNSPSLSSVCLVHFVEMKNKQSPYIRTYKYIFGKVDFGLIFARVY